jgi:hypothetical protein
MATPQNDDWSFSIFIPEPEPESSLEPVSADDAVEPQSFPDIFRRFKRVVTVDGKQVQEQWARTIDTLMNLGVTIGNRAAGWEIDEIEVGLTLSAKGELLFIAEAGAEASIKFVLKKKAVVTG